MIEHFKFLKAHTRLVPKMTIPSPSVLHFRLGYNAHQAGLSGHRRVLRRRRGGLRQGGPRLLRRRLPLPAARRHGLGLSLRREAARSRRAERGDDVDRLQERYARTINAALDGRPDDLTVTMHVCRGNFRSTWISSGGYEPVAETLLGKLDIDGYFLEYDTERAGGFEPLRFLPKGKKVVVLGLDHLEERDAGEEGRRQAADRRGDANSSPLDQLCLTPQCGFASTEEGNILTEEAQWAKLREIVEIAHEVWG